jgi:hypothetical protein
MNIKYKSIPKKDRPLPWYNMALTCTISYQEEINVKTNVIVNVIFKKYKKE